MPLIALLFYIVQYTYDLRRKYVCIPDNEPPDYNAVFNFIMECHEPLMK